MAAAWLPLLALLVRKISENSISPHTQPHPHLDYAILIPHGPLLRCLPSSLELTQDASSCVGMASHALLLIRSLSSRFSTLLCSVQGVLASSRNNLKPRFATTIVTALHIRQGKEERTRR